MAKKKATSTKTKRVANRKTGTKTRPLKKHAGKVKRDKKGTKKRKPAPSSHEPLAFAVQLFSNGTADASLTRKHRDALTDSCYSELNVALHWLPPIVGRLQRVSGFEVSSTILLFVLGGAVVFSSLVKPFVESAAKEAGKDFWAVIKQLVAKIWKTQADNVYGIGGKAYVIVDLGEESVAILLPLPRIRAGKATQKEVEKHIDQYFMELSGSWDSIQTDVSKYALGKAKDYIEPQHRRPRNALDGVIHVVTFGEDDQLRIEPMSAREFLKGKD